MGKTYRAKNDDVYYDGFRKKKKVKNIQKLKKSGKRLDKASLILAEHEKPVEFDGEE